MYNLLFELKITTTTNFKGDDGKVLNKSKNDSLI